MSDDLYEQRIKHLRNYADWERDHNGEKIHVLDWAADEIERLRRQIEGMDQVGWLTEEGKLQKIPVTVFVNSGRWRPLYLKRDY